jgi:hypothetical protein
LYEMVVMEDISNPNLSPPKKTPLIYLRDITPAVTQRNIRTPNSLCNNNQQDEYNNQNDNNSQTPILPRLPTKAIEASPRPHKLRRMPIHTLLHIIQQHHLPVQLVANLHAEFTLAPDTRAELVELVVLVGNDARVVLVDLLVVERGLVGWGVGGVVAVGEEGGAVCGVGVVVGGVGEADGFGGLARGVGFLRLGGGEVGG